MKINETGRLGAINSYQRQVESQRQASDKKAARKDELSISNEAKELLKATNTPEDSARAAKIQDLKAQVSSGTYYVDAGKIAEKLVPYFKSNQEE